MPDPKRYKNTEESYKKYMSDCMHRTMHMERKNREISVAQCLNSWRSVHGPKHPGKPKKAYLTEQLDIIASELELLDPRIALAVDKISDRLDTVED
jgi:hypothetical protein